MYFYHSINYIIITTFGIKWDRKVLDEGSRDNSVVICNQEYDNIYIKKHRHTKMYKWKKILRMRILPIPFWCYVFLTSRNLHFYLMGVWWCQISSRTHWSKQTYVSHCSKILHSPTLLSYFTQTLPRCTASCTCI